MAKFLPRLSTKVGLSRYYTNHSCRATTATVLTQEKYAMPAIQSVTGHKSLSSLAVYQKTSDEQKIEMAETLHKKLRPPSKPSCTVTSQPTPRAEEQAHCSTRGDSTLAETSLEDLDIIFNDANEPSDFQGQSYAPIFKNCTIQNVTIVYNTKN